METYRQVRDDKGSGYTIFVRTLRVHFVVSFGKATTLAEIIFFNKKEFVLFVDLGTVIPMKFVFAIHKR